MAKLKSGTRIYGNATIDTSVTVGNVQISSGIVTATSGIVTYYGDGSKLSGVASTKVVSRSVATENQTTFTVSYTIGYLDVYLNGIKLDTTEFTATNGTSVVLTEGASANDVLEFVTFTNVSLSSGTVVIDDTATNSTRYLTYTNAVSGSISSISISSTGLTFNPGTNTFSTGTLAVSSGSTTIPSISPSGDSDTGIFFPAQNTVQLGVGGVSTTAVKLTSTGDFQFNSGYGSVVTSYGCRAWVNFNGTGVVSIRGSGNVSSITDHGTGDYTVNFSTAMPDANFSYGHAYSNEVNVQHAVGFLDSISNTGLRIKHYNAANSANVADKSFIFITIFR